MVSRNDVCFSDSPYRETEEFFRTEALYYAGLVCLCIYCIGVAVYFVKHSESKRKEDTKSLATFIYLFILGEAKANKFNFPRIWGWVMLCWEGIQLSSLSFLDEFMIVKDEESPVNYGRFQKFYDILSIIALKFSNWIAALEFCLFFLVVIGASFWMYVLKKDIDNFINSVIWDMMYIPAIRSFVSVFKCSYVCHYFEQDESFTPYPPMTLYPVLSCTSPLYIAWFVAGVLGIVILHPSALYFVAFKKNDSDPAMRLMPRFNVIFYVCKLIMVVSSEFFIGVPVVVLFVNTITLFLLLVIHIRHQPCYGFGYAVNNFRSALFWAEFITSLLSLIVEINPKTVHVCVALMPSLVGCGMVLVYNCNAFRAKIKSLPNQKIGKLLFGYDIDTRLKAATTILTLLEQPDQPLFTDAINSLLEMLHSDSVSESSKNDALDLICQCSYKTQGIIAFAENGTCLKLAKLCIQGLISSADNTHKVAEIIFNASCYDSYSSMDPYPDLEDAKKEVECIIELSKNDPSNICFAPLILHVAQLANNLSITRMLYKTGLAHQLEIIGLSYNVSAILIALIKTTIVYYTSKNKKYSKSLKNDTVYKQVLSLSINPNPKVASYASYALLVFINENNDNFFKELINKCEEAPIIEHLNNVSLSLESLASKLGYVDKRDQTRIEINDNNQNTHIQSNQVNNDEDIKQYVKKMKVLRKKKDEEKEKKEKAWKAKLIGEYKTVLPYLRDDRNEEVEEEILKATDKEYDFVDDDELGSYDNDNNRSDGNNDSQESNYVSSANDSGDNGESDYNSNSSGNDSSYSNESNISASSNTSGKSLSSNTSNSKSSDKEKDEDYNNEENLDKSRNSVKNQRSVNNNNNNNNSDDSKSRKSKSGKPEMQSILFKRRECLLRKQIRDNNAFKKSAEIKQKSPMRQLSELADNYKFFPTEFPYVCDLSNRINININDIIESNDKGEVLLETDTYRRICDKYNSINNYEDIFKVSDLPHENMYRGFIEGSIDRYSDLKRNSLNDDDDDYDDASDNDLRSNFTFASREGVNQNSNKTKTIVYLDKKREKQERIILKRKNKNKEWSKIFQQTDVVNSVNSNQNPNKCYYQPVNNNNNNNTLQGNISVSPPISLAPSPPPNSDINPSLNRTLKRTKKANDINSVYSKYNGNTLSESKEGEKKNELLQKRLLQATMKIQGSYSHFLIGDQSYSNGISMNNNSYASNPNNNALALAKNLKAGIASNNNNNNRDMFNMYNTEVNNQISLKLKLNKLGMNGIVSEKSSDETIRLKMEEKLNKDIIIDKSKIIIKRILLDITEMDMDKYEGYSLLSSAEHSLDITTKTNENDDANQLFSLDYDRIFSEGEQMLNKIVNIEDGLELQLTSKVPLSYSLFRILYSDPVANPALIDELYDRELSIYKLSTNDQKSSNNSHRSKNNIKDNDNDDSNNNNIIIMDPLTNIPYLVRNLPITLAISIIEIIDEENQKRIKEMEEKENRRRRRRNNREQENKRDKEKMKEVDNEEKSGKGGKGGKGGKDSKGGKSSIGKNKKNKNNKTLSVQKPLWKWKETKIGSHTMQFLKDRIEIGRLVFKRNENTGLLVISGDSSFNPYQRVGGIDRYEDLYLLSHTGEPVYEPKTYLEGSSYALHRLKAFLIKTVGEKYMNVDKIKRCLGEDYYGLTQINDLLDFFVGVNGLEQTWRLKIWQRPEREKDDAILRTLKPKKENEEDENGEVLLEDYKKLMEYWDIIADGDRIEAGHIILTAAKQQSIQTKKLLDTLLYRTYYINELYNDLGKPDKGYFGTIIKNPNKFNGVFNFPNPELKTAYFISMVCNIPPVASIIINNKMKDTLLYEPECSLYFVQLVRGVGGYLIQHINKLKFVSEKDLFKKLTRPIEFILCIYSVFSNNNNYNVRVSNVYKDDPFTENIQNITARVCGSNPYLHGLVVSLIGLHVLGAADSTEVVVKELPSFEKKEYNSEDEEKKDKIEQMKRINYYVNIPSLILEGEYLTWFYCQFKKYIFAVASEDLKNECAKFESSFTSKKRERRIRSDNNSNNNDSSLDDMFSIDSNFSDIISDGREYIPQILQILNYLTLNFSYSWHATVFWCRYNRIFSFVNPNTALERKDKEEEDEDSAKEEEEDGNCLCGRKKKKKEDGENEKEKKKNTSDSDKSSSSSSSSSYSDSDYSSDSDNGSDSSLSYSQSSYSSYGLTSCSHSYSSYSESSDSSDYSDYSSSYSSSSYRSESSNDSDSDGKYESDEEDEDKDEKSKLTNRIMKKDEINVISSYIKKKVNSSKSKSDISQNEKEKLEERNKLCIEYQTYLTNIENHMDKNKNEKLDMNDKFERNTDTPIAISFLSSCLRSKIRAIRLSALGAVSALFSEQKMIDSRFSTFEDFEKKEDKKVTNNKKKDSEDKSLGIIYEINAVGKIFEKKYVCELIECVKYNIVLYENDPEVNSLCINIIQEIINIYNFLEIKKRKEKTVIIIKDSLLKPFSTVYVIYWLSTLVTNDSLDVLTSLILSAKADDVKKLKKTMVPFILLEARNSPKRVMAVSALCRILIYIPTVQKDDEHKDKIEYNRTFLRPILKLLLPLLLDERVRDKLIYLYYTHSYFVNEILRSNTNRS